MNDSVIKFLTFSDEEEVDGCVLALLDLNGNGCSRNNTRSAPTANNMCVNIVEDSRRNTEPGNVNRGRWEMRIEESVGD